MSSTLKSIIALVAGLAVSVLTLYFGPLLNFHPAVTSIVALAAPAVPIIYVLTLLTKKG
ncbi:hypothetical protein MM300_10525 [Evansella sp. LMS18]|jgi:hypothetical protein|uniref:hypothetical protein n=1 Tax=Evansella sp. LMS18 TaxID=2924033 RepID=UPI0020D096F5|nr:hypothetical protein [Evansella sp. LMS18]UTR12670.1 hypothetical protein MM300_10525 [Evansella sp. LMS18]